MERALIFLGLVEDPDAPRGPARWSRMWWLAVVPAYVVAAVVMFLVIKFIPGP